MKKVVKISKEVEAILKPYNEEIKDYIRVLQDKSDADIKQHTGALSEEFKGRIKAVAEQFGGLNTKVDKMQGTLDSHTEIIGKLAVDMEIVKTNVEFMKDSLKKKVDYDEFIALERRVHSLEGKAK